MRRWPRRRAQGVARARNRPRRPTPVQQSAQESIPQASEVSPVPRRRTDAAWAILVNIGILAVLAFLGYRTVEHWTEVAVPGQVALVLIGTLTLLCAVLFAVSILVYLLPRLIGLRRPRAAPPPNDSL